MEIFSILFIVIGLCLLEVVMSLDNAVVNADVLATMEKKYQRWFLVWGILIAVFFIRGFLPWLLVWISNPSIGFLNAFWATFSSDPEIVHSIEKSSPLILMIGGVFLLFLFFHWLFLEPKSFGLIGEKFFSRQGVWFFAIVSILLSVIIWFSLKKNPLLSFCAALGSSLFFLVHGFREYAAKYEKEITGTSKMSNITKLFYLEVLDASFSFDGVIGAFAFTFSVPLIILGNGLGALIVRQLTIKGVEKIKKYPLLKNGAMYSIFFLSLLMILKAFGIETPDFLPPLISILTIGYFLKKSIKK